MRNERRRGCVNRSGSSMASSMRDSSRGSKLDLMQPPLTLRLARHAQRPENGPVTSRIGTSTTTRWPHRCSIPHNGKSARRLLSAAASIPCTKLPTRPRERNTRERATPRESARRRPERARRPAARAGANSESPRQVQESGVDLVEAVGPRALRIARQHMIARDVLCVAKIRRPNPISAGRRANYATRADPK